MTNPLPFDDLPINTSPDLLDRLEELQPMSYERLDSAGISASAVRNYIILGRKSDLYTNDWDSWKEAVCAASGKSWTEIAPLIYKDF